MAAPEPRDERRHHAHDGELPDLDTQIEREQGPRQRCPRKVHHPQHRRKAKAMDEAKKEMVIQDELATRRFVMSELFTHAKEADGVGHKLKALELMGKAVGMFVDKVESKVEEINAEQLKNELASHLELLNSATKKH